MKDLIIVGAGGTSREIAALLEGGGCGEQLWNLLGFLDDDPTKHGTRVDGLPILGPIALAPQRAVQFIVGVAAVADQAARKRIVASLSLGRERFATLIHSSASVSAHAHVGVGCAIMQNAVIASNATIGDHVMIHYNCAIAHDCEIGDYVTMAPGALISGRVRIGSNAFLGSGCRVMDDVVVGEQAVVGIGAVVVRDVAPGARVLGNPARVFSAP